MAPVEPVGVGRNGGVGKPPSSTSWVFPLLGRRRTASGRRNRSWKHTVTGFETWPGPPPSACPPAPSPAAPRSAQAHECPMLFNLAVSLISPYSLLRKKSKKGKGRATGTFRPMQTGACGTKSSCSELLNRSHKWLTSTKPRARPSSGPFPLLSLV